MLCHFFLLSNGRERKRKERERKREKEREREKKGGKESGEHTAMIWKESNLKDAKEAVDGLPLTVHFSRFSFGLRAGVFCADELLCETAQRNMPSRGTELCTLQGDILKNGMKRKRGAEGIARGNACPS